MFQSVQHGRKKQVVETCSAYNLSADMIGDSYVRNYYQAMKEAAFREPRSSLMMLKEWSLLYCWIHKAASTSWNKARLSSIFISLLIKA